MKPLQEIFKGTIFQNPANDKYGWVGADKARVIFLNDFRWNKKTDKLEGPTTSFRRRTCKTTCSQKYV